MQLAPRPGNLNQNGLKPNPLMMSPTKNPKLSHFFQCYLEDSPYLWGCEQLSSSIVWQVMGLQSDGKKVADVGLKGKTNLELKVLIMCCVTILKCCLILTKIF